MRSTRWSWVLVAFFASAIPDWVAGPAVAESDDVPPRLGQEQREQFERGMRELTARLDKIRGEKGRKPAVKADRLADAEVYAKGLEWALRYDKPFEPADVAILTQALGQGRARVAALESGKEPWAEAKGRVVRGYVSALDGSVQPYGMVVPVKYDRTRPMRLDVVLHGSSRPVGRASFGS